MPNASAHEGWLPGSMRPTPDDRDGREQESRGRLERKRRSRRPRRRQLADRGRELRRVGDDRDAPHDDDGEDDGGRRAEQEPGDDRTGARQRHGGDRQRRPPEAIGQRAGSDAAHRARSHDEECDGAGALCRHVAAQREAGRQEGRDPGPHRVQLPHVAEVAEVREPHGWLRQRRTSLADAEPRRGDRQRAIADRRPRDRGGQHAREASGDHDQAPVEIDDRPSGAERIRDGRAERDRPDQDADREATLAGEPPGQHLHRHRVDGRDPGAAQRAQRDRRGEIDREQPERGVGRSRDERPDGDEPARGDDVGGTGQCQNERADRESDLDRHRQERRLEAVDPPFRRDERCHGRGAEPWDEREDDRGRQGDEDPPASRWLVDHPAGSARNDSTRSS